MDSATLKKEPQLLPRAYYSASVNDFLSESDDSILGKLTANSEFSVDQTQRDAWLQEFTILRQELAGCGDRKGALETWHPGVPAFPTHRKTHPSVPLFMEERETG